jgi:hypothetical protein
MKTKTPSARVMWANYYPQIRNPAIYASRNSAEECAAGFGKTICVAVIPLDDVDDMVVKATGAYWSGEATMSRGDAMRRALSAIGIPCRKRKARQ